MSGLRRIALFSLLVLAAVLAPAALVAMRAERGQASFGDSARIGENRIASATLSIDVGDRTVALAGHHVAPGDVVVGAIELVNDGTIPLRYALVSEPTDGELLPWVVWRFAWSANGSTCTALADSTGLTHSGIELAAGLPIIGDAATGFQSGDRRLDVGGHELLCATAALSFDAPNSVQSAELEQRFTVWAEYDQ